MTVVPVVVIAHSEEEREEIRAARRVIIERDKDIRRWAAEANEKSAMRALGLRYHLDPRRQFVLFARQFMVPPLTLAETAEHLGIGRERVRQLERDALTSLRAAWSKYTITDKGEE